MKRLLSQIIASTLGLWLAMLFIQGVVIRAYPESNFFGFSLTERWQIILILGGTLGLLNYFLKPLLKMLALPLEIITLGLFTIIINAGLLWVLDMMFDEFYLPLWQPLIYTTLLMWVLNIVIGFFLAKKED